MIMQGSSQELRASRFPRGHRRRGDSDSEDDDFTSDHTSGPDYDSAGDEVNDRILQALERLHQDMKSVLRRLSSMEEAVMSRQVSSRLLYVFSDTVFENPQCEHCLYQNLVITITYFAPQNHNFLFWKPHRYDLISLVLEFLHLQSFTVICKKYTEFQCCMFLRQ